MNSRMFSGLLIAGIALIGAGCSEDSESEVATTSVAPFQAPALDEDTSEAPAPLSEAEAVAVPENQIAAARAAEPVQNEGVTPEPDEALLGPLQEVIDSFVSQTGRTPAGFEELVNGRFMSRLPKAPAGKRYVIHPKTAQLSLARL